jgi:hypothetical protein
MYLLSMYNIPNNTKETYINMAKIIGSPLRYIQGNNEINNIAKDVKDWGTSFFFLVDKLV